MKQVIIFLMVMALASCQKTVEVPVDSHTKIESLAIIAKTDNLFVGEKTSLKVTILPKCTEDMPIKFVSSDESVAVVDSDGKVTAKSAGTVIVSVQSASDKQINSTVELLVKNQSEGTYAVGDYFPDPLNPSTAIGIVFYIDKTDESYFVHNEVGFSKRGKIISVDEKQDIQFSLVEEWVLTSLSHDDGESNTIALCELENYETNYPALGWVLSKNVKTSIVRWYLPAYRELDNVYLTMFGPEFYDMKINDKFELTSGTPIKRLMVDYCITSTLYSTVTRVIAMDFLNGQGVLVEKNRKNRVRAVAKF